MSGIVSASLPLWAALAALIVAAAVTYLAIVVLRPILLRIALARPNARSSIPNRRRKAAASRWSA